QHTILKSILNSQFLSKLQTNHPTKANTMTGTDLYDASIPLFKNGLQSLKHILTKTTEHYGPNTPPSEILNATLIEDLRPLVLHVQLCSNISKKSIARMATGLTPEVWEDNE